MSHAVNIALIATMQRELGDEIEDLGAQICADPDLASRMIAQLQSFDLIAQKQRALGELLARELSEEAIAEVSLEAVQQRLLS